jgi:hypothetical protein
LRNAPETQNPEETELRATESSLNTNQMPDDVSSALGSRYSDIVYISSGATASVFGAHDSNLDKRVAIKVLRYLDERNLISFQKEAKSAAKLDHRNLVSILNFGKTHKNRAYLIMGFVDGKSLETIIEEQGRLPLPLAINLLIQICDGLKHAHSKHIAHRDLKTSNIMIENFETEPSAVIVDFGLAKDHDQEKSRTDTGAAVGSPLYMSPEQAQGKLGDERSDIYGLACIAYRMIAGETPFYSEDMFDLLRQHIDEEPPLLSDLAPAWEIPETLDLCLKKMLAKNPKDRPQTVIEVKETFSRILHTLEEAKHPATTNGAAEAKPSAAREKTLLRIVHAVLPAVAVAGLLAAASALAIFVLQDSHGSDAKAQSIDEKLNEIPIVNLRLEDMSTTAEFPRIRKLFKASGDADYMEHSPQYHYMPFSPAKLMDADLRCFQHYTTKDKVLPISLGRTSITGEGLKYMNVPNVRVLDLSATNLTEKGFAELVKLKYVDRLALEDCQIDEKRVVALRQMPALNALFLDGCKNVDRNIIEDLIKFPHLKELGLSNTDITLADIKLLKECKSLEVLILNNTVCNDDAIAELARLPNLRDIQLNECPRITDKSLTMITKAVGKNLVGLGLSGTSVSRKEIACLSSCPNLEWLSLGKVPLEDEDLEVIRGLKNLKDLHLSNMKASDQAIYKMVLSLRKLTSTGILYSNLSGDSERKIRSTYSKCGLITDCVHTGNIKPEDKDSFDFIMSSQER